MKKSQYVHKITLYKIKSFEPKITNKKCLSYKNKSYLHGLYGMQIFNELMYDKFPNEIIKYIKKLLLV
tara:strand:+ start:61 stop:264 length:204 start_codon:yes stop_codon:yes gene_type:complete